MSKSNVNVIQMTPVDRLHPHPQNVRSTLGDLRTLVNSVKAQGILEPLLVRTNDDGFEIIAGHRRFAAANEAELTEVPVIVRDLTDEEAVAIMLVENLQREDIEPYDEAEGYFRLVEFGWTQKKLAEEVGVSAATIRNRLRLLALPVAWGQENTYSPDQLAEMVDLVDDEQFDEEAALAHFKAGAPNPRQLQGWLDARRLEAEREIAKATLPEGEEYVELEGGKLPRNHVFVAGQDGIPWGNDKIAVDLEVLRGNGHLGWTVVSKGYGADREIITLAVVTDRGYYTRKSSKADPEERPEGWEEQQAEAARIRQEREDAKAREADRRARAIHTAKAANKTELIDVILRFTLNEVRDSQLRDAAEEFGYAEVATAEEAAEGPWSLNEGKFYPEKTIRTILELSQTKQVEFLAGLYMLGTTAGEQEQALLDEYAPALDEADE